MSEVDRYPRRFALVRDVDETGISGTGFVAAGTEYPDGCVTLRWLTASPTSVGHYDIGMDAVWELHGHKGATRVLWLDDADGHELAEPVLYQPGDRRLSKPELEAGKLRAQVAELARLLDEAQLRSIEARNPGIDMAEVRRLRASPAG